MQFIVGYFYYFLTKCAFFACIIRLLLAGNNILLNVFLRICLFTASDCIHVECTTLQCVTKIYSSLTFLKNYNSTIVCFFFVFTKIFSVYHLLLYGLVHFQFQFPEFLPHGVLQCLHEKPPFDDNHHFLFQFLLFVFYSL